MERTCARCPYLSLTEAEQDQLRKWRLAEGDHVCNLYNRVLNHKKGSLDIMPCAECVSAPLLDGGVFYGFSDVPVLQQDYESDYELAYK